MNHWTEEAFFYHIYPLGFCGAPERNDFQSEPVERLLKVKGWIGHMKGLGVNALYLGPLFQSEEHGYDTVDYFQVDRRLGTDRTLQELTWALHENGIKVILDGVFNHVSRSFFAFKDLLEQREGSRYRDWFSGLDFSANNPYNDGFSYDAWDGHYNLVKLNLNNSEVREHLFSAVRKWIEEYGIDGLRLDAADVMDLNFLRELKHFAARLKPDFWMTGEVVHGDYSRWANSEIIHSTTNYECYKGLYSSHNDKNYFEIAYSLKRQFGEGGIYRGLPLYNFADNHDVDRIAHSLKNEAHLYPLYGLLFTIPGIPSIYYGSEWGLKGHKSNGSDKALRPELELDHMGEGAEHPELVGAIKRLARCRRESKALRQGDYRQLAVEHELLIFERSLDGERVIVAVNSSAEETVHNLKGLGAGEGYDILNERRLELKEGALELTIPPYWLSIVRC